MGQQYSAPHLKTHAKNIEHRCSLLTNKRANEIRQSKKKVARLLKDQKDESARFEMLQIVRFEKFLMAYKLFVLAGRLITDSIGTITASQLCPSELLDACSTIIFGADRFSDIPELKSVSEQLFAKYGENFVATFRVNRDGQVNPQLVKACVQPNPIKDDTIKYLKYLAKEHGVTWEPKDDFGPESLGCMKAFPLGYMDDGSTDICIPEDEPEPAAEVSEAEEQEEPPQYEEADETPPPQEPPKQEHRGPHYYFEPEKPQAPQMPANAHIYQQPAPAPAPVPAPAPAPAPVPVEPARVAAYPAAAPQPVPSPVAAYPARPVAAYPAAAPAVAAYPAATSTQSSPQHRQQQQHQQQQQPQQPQQPQQQPQQQQQQQPPSQPQSPQSNNSQAMSLEERLARLQGK